MIIIYFRHAVHFFLLLRLILYYLLLIRRFLSHFLHYLYILISQYLIYNLQLEIYLLYFLYIHSGWSDKIETVNWKYGDIYFFTSKSVLFPTFIQKCPELSYYHVWITLCPCSCYLYIGFQIEDWANRIRISQIKAYICMPCIFIEECLRLKGKYRGWR